MPRTIRIFDVFVASPSDVSEERDCLEESIRELNQSWQRRLGVQLNLIRWETSAYPGFGEDAQDVINKTAPERADVFIGILWTRIGTPTGRAESGTLEEFENAYRQWERDPASIRLLIYFKKDTPPRLDSIDPQQLNSVRVFESSLPARGGLSWKFTTTDEFRSIVRKHLALLVQDLAELPAGTTAVHSDSQENVGPAVLEGEEDLIEEGEDFIEDEDGLFELVDKWSDGMAVVTSITAKFTGSLERLTESMHKGLAELQDPAVKENRTAAKRSVNSIANQLEILSDVLRTDTPVLREAFRESIASLDKAIEVAPDFGEEGIENICESGGGLSNLREAIGKSKETMEDMRNTIESLPRVTTRFNRAKRSAVRSLEDLDRTLDSARVQIGSSLELLDRLCDGS